MALGSLPEQQAQPHHQNHHGHYQQYNIAGGKVVGQGVQAAVQNRQVRHRKGCHAIEQNKSVKELDIEDIQAELLKEKATLMYFKDITVDSPDFEMVQYMGLRGYITDWAADLDRPMDRDMAKSWSTMSGITIEKFEGKSRRDILQAVYDLIR